LSPIFHWTAIHFTLGMIAGAAFTVFGYWWTGR